MSGLTLLFCLIFTVSRVSSMYELGLNDACISSITNAEGVCKDPRQCDQFKANRAKINICSFKEKIPIVCCPKSGNSQSAANKPIEIQHVTNKPNPNQFITTQKPLQRPPQQNNNFQRPPQQNSLDNRFGERISEKSKI
jgi:hypothetical protein